MNICLNIVFISLLLALILLAFYGDDGERKYKLDIEMPDIDIIPEEAMAPQNVGQELIPTDLDEVPEAPELPELQDGQEEAEAPIQENGVEPFNEEVGQFCKTCRGKTFNQCLGCFNCGFCVDKWGNGGCIGGDHKGPFNFERCAKWYSGDPYSFMMQQNADYGCDDGPRSSNRVIGI